MGMSIDEAIPILHDMYNYYNDADIDAYVGFDKEDNNAIEIALETMRKYQKITEIVAHYRENVRDKVTNENMEKILEVVEDGK